MKRKPQHGGQPSASGSTEEEQQTELLRRLYALTYEERVEKSVQARCEIEDLCRRYPFIARERARMVKERQEGQVVLARRARRGEPLIPIKVIKANGRVRQFGPRLPSGRAPRRACNLHVHGSRRASGSRSPPSGDDDPGGEDDDHHLNHHLLADHQLAGDRR